VIPNSKLLQTPKALLSHIDRQRGYLLEMALEPMACPACGTKCCIMEACGKEFDEFDLGGPYHTNEHFHCTGCNRELIHDVYIVGGQGWSLAPHEQEKLK